MELPITTPLLLPPLFSSNSCRPVFVTLGDRLYSAEAIAGTPGLDFVADEARPGATEVINFGGASGGKSGSVAGKRDRTSGETVSSFGLDSGLCFAGASLMIFLTGFSNDFGTPLLLIGFESGLSGRVAEADVTDVEPEDAGVGLVTTPLSCRVGGLGSGFCLVTDPSLLNLLMIFQRVSDLPCHELCLLLYGLIGVGYKRAKFEQIEFLFMFGSFEICFIRVRLVYISSLKYLFVFDSFS